MLGYFFFATGTNIFSQITDSFLKQEIAKTEDSLQVQISPSAIYDTLNNGERSEYHINLINKENRTLNYQITGDFIYCEKNTNRAVKIDSTNEIIACGDLGFGKDVNNITVEAWYKPFNYKRECGIWEFLCPDSGFMFTLGIWNTTYSAKNRGCYHYYTLDESENWRHVAITWNGKEQRLYENGEEIELSYTDFKPKQTGPNLDLYHKPFFIGTKDNNRHRAFGMIDEVRVWNKVKTKQEIRHEMNHELSGLEDNLMGYWNFNETAGDTAFDISGNQHHGIFRNQVERVSSTSPVAPFNWLEINPSSGEIPINASKEIKLEINTKYLKGGDYSSSLFVREDVSNEMIAIIPVKLHVVEAPHIFIPADTINFNDVFTRNAYQKSVVVRNSGYEPLSIHKISSNNRNIKVDSSHFVLDECQEQVLNVSYKASIFDQKYYSLIIYSNDPVFPKKEIIVTRDQIMVPKTRLFRWTIAMVILFMLIIVGLAYYRYRLKNKLNKELEEKVKEAVETQQEQQRIIIHQSGIAILGELAAGISDEINQPMQKILHATEMQALELDQKKPDWKQIEKMIQEQYAEISKIKEIVDHIRIFSSQQKTNIIEEFSVGDCIHDAILLLKQQLINNQIHIQLNLAENLPLIEGNPHKLEQTLINILNNSRDALETKATENGGGLSKKIEIKTTQLNGSIRILIEDNGIGIPDKDLALVFEPFFTTKNTDKRIGLGLAIAREVITEMNGTIDVHSTWQIGTKVYINVPVGPETLHIKA